MACSKPDVGTVALILFNLIAVVVVIVEVVVAEIVGGRGNTLGRMVNGFLKPTILGAVGIVIT